MTSAPARAASSAVARNSEWATYRTLFSLDRHRNASDHQRDRVAHRGRLIAGVSSAPVYGELAYAEIGHGAWLNEQPIKVSDIASIETGAISTGNLKTLASGPRWARFGKLVTRAQRIRGYGDFLHYHLLAAGKIEAVIESDVNILDIAALAVIVEAAGGRFTDLEGRALDLNTSSVLASNGRLHDEVLRELSG